MPIIIWLYFLRDFCFSVVVFFYFLLLCCSKSFESHIFQVLPCRVLFMNERLRTVSGSRSTQYTAKAHSHVVSTWKLKAKSKKCSTKKAWIWTHKKNTRKKEKIISETPQCKSWYDMENIWIQIQKDSTPIGIHRDVHMYMYCRLWYTACVCLHVSVLHLLVYIEHMYVLGYVKVLCRLAYAASRR